MKRKICFVTSGRADGGLLRILQDAMHADYECSGVYAPVEDSCSATDGFANSSRWLQGFYDLKGHPDLMVLLGDRYEILAAACVAHLMKIPIAHIHGGELTTGSLDDSMRHAITKLSGLHFTATEGYRRRVIQMGEQPSRVFNVGALGLDGIENVKAKGSGHFLITYHPETLGHGDVDELISALEAFPNEKIWCTANADDGGKEINAKIPGQTFSRDEYLSLMKGAAMVIGNSSAGIIEAPSLGVNTVNIGDRQRDRARASSIYDCPCDANKIRETIRVALSMMCSGTDNPYGYGGVAESIKAVLAVTDFPSLIHKTFYDMEVV